MRMSKLAEVLDAATGDVAVAAAAEPDWWVPADFYVREAKQYERHSGLDRALAQQLLRDARPSFDDYDAFVWPTRKSVVKPEKTVPGMNAAGARLAEALQSDEKIAVFCDYDPDGTTGAEALRLACAPYMSDPCPGCSGRKGADCFSCGGTGKLFQSERWISGCADAQQGFGLTHDFVREAHAAGATLLVSVDCGSTQTAQVALAQSLGMQVIVVDHHDIDPDNPADHHLNPKLHEPVSSQNTGAQLAWKLGAATQMAISGRTRPEHWKTAMYLAGFGARADMGPVKDLENRAFFWVPLDDDEVDPIPPGLRRLSERLGEDPREPSGGILTSACMNLPKRTGLVSAHQVSQILAAPSEAHAHEMVEELVAAYERARPVRRRLAEASVAQVSETDARVAQRLAQAEADLRSVLHRVEKAKKISGDASDLTADVERAVTDVAAATRQSAARERVGVAILDEEPDYAGYSGAIASSSSRETGRPMIVFTRRGEDEDGRVTYKFSMRNEAGIPHKVGELITDAQMRNACELTRPNEAGERETAPSIGGHPEVVSGGCYADKIDEVVAAVDAWSERCAGSKTGWRPPTQPRADAYLSERRMPAERFLKAEEQSRRLRPYSFKDRHMAARVSIEGELVDEPVLDEDTGHYRTRLRLADGSERDAMISAARVDDAPRSGLAEWVVSIEGRPELWLSKWHVSATPALA